MAKNDTPGATERFDGNNIKAVQSLFEEKGKGLELAGRLRDYRQQMLNIDSVLRINFENNSPVNNSLGVFEKNGSWQFRKEFFRQLPVVAALAMLSGFENNIRVMENNFVLFCHNSTFVVDGCNFGDRIAPVIAQSSNIVRAGDMIEITAGVGNFSSATCPRFTINGKTINDADHIGYITYRLKAVKQPGEHLVPVSISYINPDGTKAAFSQKIKYIVSQ